MKRFLVVALLATAIGGCVLSSSPNARDSGTKRLDVERELIQRSDELATAISRRDADGAALGVREDDHVAYVSDGNVIRGNGYRDVLRRFYSGVQQIDFRWDQREVVTFAQNVGVVTGWATISITNLDGVNSISKAVFTLVYRKDGGLWELVTAHKTTLP